MSKKGKLSCLPQTTCARWRIINAVEAATLGHPEQFKQLTPDDIENRREAQLLEEYHHEKNARSTCRGKPMSSLADAFAKAGM